MLQKDYSKRPSIDDLMHKLQEQVRCVIEDFKQDEQMIEALYESLIKYHPLYFDTPNTTD